MLLKYLHLSDFHLTNKGDSATAFNQDWVTSTMIEKIGELAAGGDVFHFVVITGDLAKAGKVAEYKVVQAMLERLLDTTGLERNHLFLVPGNHDVDRDAIRKPHHDRLCRFDSQDEITRAFSQDADLSVLTQKFNAFKAFADDAMGAKRFADKTFHFTETMRLPSDGDDAYKINLIGLNSAMYAGYDGDDHGKLALGLWQVVEAKKRMEKDALLSIAFFHHPFECFHSCDRVSQNVLTDEMDVIHTGHLHEPDNVFWQGAAGSTARISAGACFETREKENSFNAVEIDLDAGTGKVLFYKYLPDFGKWKDNTDANPHSDDGSFSFVVSGISGRYPIQDEYELLQLDFRQKDCLVSALLECDAIRNRETRKTIVNELPPEIRDTIEWNDVNYDSVMLIVNRCLKFENGLESLIAVVKAFERNSIGMRNLENLLSSLRKS